MQIVKRDGRLEEVKLEKITRRVKAQSKGLKNVDAMSISTRVIAGLYDKVSTRELDELAIKTAANLATTHPDYDTLAARLSVSVLHKETKGTFSTVMEDLHKRVDSFGRARPAVSEEFMKVVRKHKKAIDAEIVYKRDYEFDYLGLQTLKRSYLQKINGKIIERPQHMWMRVALGIHGKDIVSALDTYEKLSKKMFTHATPTLFNAGTAKPQLASCFLLHMDDDSIDGIYKTLTDCAKISQLAGGIGIHIHNIRSSGSPIYGTNGKSNGIVPMLRAYNATANYIDQCFAKESRVLTKNGWKPIGGLSTDDEVKTSANTFEKVKDVKEFTSPTTLCEVATDGGQVRVTDDHIFLCVRDSAHLSDNDLINKIKKGFIEVEWVAAKELTTQDVIISYV